MLDSFAKKESSASSPGAGNCTTSRLYNTEHCSFARRMVAVDAITLGKTPFCPQIASTAVSYKPTTVPKAPEIRCNSSWMMSSGVRLSEFIPKKAPIRPSQGSMANLSTVPNSNVGGASYSSSSIIWIGSFFVKSQSS